VQHLPLRKNCALIAGSSLPATVSSLISAAARARPRTALQLDVRYVTKRPYLAAAKEFLGG
jgi:hypothetical protein